MATWHLINMFLLGVVLLLSVASVVVALDPQQEYGVDTDDVLRIVGIAASSVVMVCCTHGWGQAPVSVVLLILALFTYVFLDGDVRALRDRKKRVAEAWAKIRAGREARELAAQHVDEATETD
ncbi:TPA: hypothetical protein QDB43_000257 [Burkholderia vietnamiensis]|uniref:hypothetical protein n=1 Tax=Burkholderia TaxID=32008 RepID=UPI000F06D455|nr:hypothetical protein [Burkholderia pseudomallei]MCW0163730.1 hypothetical protein [Burkholderia pseudomallei]VBG63471.1 Uncharacterised protein [Burkholderia pseudomallei]HDR9236573.1 hypothetical protein [Burkholderia vietnamiensis]